MNFAVRRRTSKIAALVFTAAMAALLLFTSCQAGVPKYASLEKAVPKVQSGEISFDVSITPDAGKDIKLWLPYPTSNDYQAIQDVNISGNYDSAGVYREPESGTVMLYAEWTKPEEQAVLHYSFEISRTEMLRKDFKDFMGEIPVETRKYLEATSLGPTIGDVKETAQRITKGKTTILEKATAIYDWIIENFERDPNIVGCGIGDVESLLKTQAGKCTDISSVFVALSRSVGVPAREIFGIRMPVEGDITSAYHCRAEFYLPGYGWVPVDPSDVRKYILNNGCNIDSPNAEEVRDYYFGNQTDTYIDFYSGRDLTLSPAQSSGPLNYLMYPYAESGGKVLDWFAQDQLKYTVSYHAG
jgi:transglutaminase-like putative cysteine protease